MEILPRLDGRIDSNEMFIRIFLSYISRQHQDLSTFCKLLCNVCGYARLAISISSSHGAIMLNESIIWFSCAFSSFSSKMHQFCVDPFSFSVHTMATSVLYRAVLQQHSKWQQENFHKTCSKTTLDCTSSSPRSIQNISDS